MYTAILTLHVIICLLVILVVLIQSGKGAGLSSVFGSGGGDALFSAPSGSLFIRKLTTGLAVGFFLTSLMLTYLSARQGLRTVTRGAWSQAQPFPIADAQGQPIMPAASGAAPETSKPAAPAAPEKAPAK